MDLKFINTVEAAERGVTFNVQQPYTEVETDFKISVTGVGSKQHRKALAAYQTALAALTKKIGEREPTPEEEDKQVQLLVAFAAECTKGWENLSSDGVAIEFSTEKAKQIYALAPEVLSQVVSQIGNMRQALGELNAS